MHGRRNTSGQISHVRNTDTANITIKSRLQGRCLISRSTAFFKVAFTVFSKRATYGNR